MDYRNLGRSGVRLSAVGLGSWLTYGGSVEETTARRCIERALELGVNFIDTANVYDRGRAEEVVGGALAPYPRESYVLATKVYFPMGEGPNDRGLSRKHVFEQCHQSLRRLGVDYIDLYQCHRWDEETPLEETCGIMDDLSRQGKILYWGVSEWSAPQIREAVELCRARGWRRPLQQSARIQRASACDRAGSPADDPGAGLGERSLVAARPGDSDREVPLARRRPGRQPRGRATRRVHAPILARGGSGCRRSSGSTGGEGGVLDVPAGPGVVPAATRGDERHRRRDFHPARRRQRGRCGQADRPRAARGDDPPPGPRPGAAHLTGWKREGRRGNLGKWLAPMLAVRC